MIHKTLFLVAVLALVVGCATDLGGVFEQTSAAKSALSEQRDFYQAELNAAVASGDDARAAKIAKQISDINSAESELEAAERETAKYINDDGSLNEGAVAREVSLSLPFPANLGVLLAVAGLQELRRSRAVAQQKNISAEIVASIDAMREESPVLTDAMSDTDVKRAAWNSMSDKTWQFIDLQRNT